MSIGVALQMVLSQSPPMGVDHHRRQFSHLSGCAIICVVDAAVPQVGVFSVDTSFPAQRPRNISM